MSFRYFAEACFHFMSTYMRANSYQLVAAFSRPHAVGLPVVRLKASPRRAAVSSALRKLERPPADAEIGAHLRDGELVSFSAAANVVKAGHDRACQPPCRATSRSVAIPAIVKRPCLRSVAALAIDQQRAQFPSRLATLAQ
jgi:hypothetical protein